MNQGHQGQGGGISQETLLQGVEMLPPISPTVVRLAKTINQPDTGAGHIEQIVNLDPALTSNVLRLANSAYFGLQRKVISVRQAVVILGSKRVFELAMSSAFGHVIPRTIPGYQVKAGDFWIHNVSVAILSEVLAKNCGFWLPDLTFTAGLLHDVGKLVLSAALSLRFSIGDEGVPPGEENPTSLEQERWGLTHAEAGRLLTETWGLPDQILWAATYHHTPNEAPPGSDQMLIDLIHAADATAHALRRSQKGGDDEPWEVRADEDVVKRLQLAPDEVEAWAQEAWTSIEATAKLYEAS